jgi:transposase-like protein/IS1 family transposase
MTCTRCKHETCKRFGTYGKRRIQRWRCNFCKITFCQPQAQSPLGTMRTSEEAAARAVQCLAEGCSIRSTERLTGLNRNTILRLLEVIGPRCERLLDSRMRNLRCRYLQCDEIWTFVQKKQRRVKNGEREIGDQWVFVAMDADTKLVASFQIGKRSIENTRIFMSDLHDRLANQVQITTDGFHFYTKVVEETFGLDVDFAQLVKLFGDYGQHDSPDARYSPPRITEVISKMRIGNPSKADISTSYVERQNLTIRMGLRRFTRLTNAFSKKLDNLKAAVAIHFAYYNFCRVHSTLRVTPAMEAGLTDHVWSIGELLGVGSER